MIQRICALLLLLMVIACKGFSQSVEQKKAYIFPNTSIVKSIPKDCFENEDDQLINAASGLESFFLNAFSDEVSVNDENSYGKKFNQLFIKDLVFLNDSNLVRLQNILKKLTPYCSRIEISYTIALVQNDSDVNAWTHAGGYIYVTTGLLKFVNTEDELAFCIAHEIGHNENEHCKATVQRIKTAVNMGASADMVDMATSMYSSIFAAFNQPQEIESDLAGVYLAYMAGYDPEKALAFFDKLSLNEQPNALEKMIRSHPFASERKIGLQCYLDYAIQ
jgi:predicted Zn-dependent protease